MAVTNTADPSRLGQVNKAGDDKALFEKLLMAEILATFVNANIMIPLTESRTITHGKSAAFPMFGKVSGGYHVVGESVIESDNGYLQKAGHNEKQIFIDQPLVSSTFIAEIDEAMSSYEYRSSYVREMGNFLAGEADKNILQTAILGARGSSELTTELESIEIINPGVYGSAPTVVFTGGGGTGMAATVTIDGGGAIDSVTITNVGANYTSPPVISFSGGTPTTAATAKAHLKIRRYGTKLDLGSTLKTSAAKIIEGIYGAAEELDYKNVPKYDRGIVLRPSVYWKLFTDSSDTLKAAFNRDWGGSGSLSSGTPPSIAGMPVYMSNNFPTNVKAAVTGQNNTYSGDFTNTCGLVFQKSAVGTVKLRDLKVATKDDTAERLGWLATAYYFMGHGSVRKEAAVELSSDS